MMDKLLYLSRSMGHRYIQNTLYYYRLVPLFAHQLENLTGCGYEELLPDLNDYFDMKTKAEHSIIADAIHEWHTVYLRCIRNLSHNALKSYGEEWESI